MASRSEYTRSLALYVCNNTVIQCNCLATQHNTSTGAVHSFICGLVFIFRVDLKITRNVGTKHYFFGKAIYFCAPKTSPISRKRELTF
jgi:hypothetical protein